MDTHPAPSEQRPPRIHSHGPTVPRSHGLGGMDGPLPGRGAFILMWLSHSLCPAAAGRKLPHLSSVHVPHLPPKGQFGLLKGQQRTSLCPDGLPGPVNPRARKAGPPVGNAAEPAAPCSHLLAFSHHGHGPGVTVTLRPPCPPLGLVYTVQQFTFHKTVSRLSLLCNSPRRWGTSGTER